ncbi:uncharacterized protein LOC120781098 [Bactrocera tryoni]|uniref:uncharacterized protein LOC120781098 n=1 Tax=Bactrocera tryoni TaxID=59916 RepID=UPI001A97437B|nr:uncharacterized protein LOC120781098 [Bactrocera tryoni]
MSYKNHLNFQLNNPKAKNFSTNVTSVRRVAENALGHLKARFRRFGRGKVLATIPNDTVNQQRIEQENIARHPHRSHTDRCENSSGIAIRQAIAAYFSTMT